MKCVTCNRDPDRMNSVVAECSHASCPHRKGTFHPETRYLSPKEEPEGWCCDNGKKLGVRVCPECVIWTEIPK